VARLRKRLHKADGRIAKAGCIEEVQGRVVRNVDGDSEDLTLFRARRLAAGDSNFFGFSP